jgi:hypothetical protein
MADAEIEAELRVSPERAGLDFIEIFDQVERPQAAAPLKRPPEFGREYLVLVLALDLAGYAEADSSSRHVCHTLDHGGESPAVPAQAHHPNRVRGRQRGRGATPGCS